MLPRACALNVNPAFNRVNLRSVRVFRVSNALIYVLFAFFYVLFAFFRFLNALIHVTFAFFHVLFAFFSRFKRVNLRSVRVFSRFKRVNLRSVRVSNHVSIGFRSLLDLPCRELGLG